MATLTEASLSEDERRVVERLVELMRERFGPRLRSVWLYGSRARGEPPGPESDIDLLVITDRKDGRDVSWDDMGEAIGLSETAVEELGVEWPILSIKVYDPAWLAGRREIASFFIQEVDRDKIVLHGER